MKRSSNRPVDGAHKEFFAGGAISAEGLLRNGKRHGKWKYYYRNGRPKAVGKYVYGEFDGGWEWWRENGQSLQVGAFKNGKQVGLWKRYYENGQLWDEGTYEDGKKLATGSVRQSWCAQAKQGLQGEEVKRASDSFEANTVFQLDMVAGLSGQAKRAEVRKRFGRRRFGARPNDYRV